MATTPSPRGCQREAIDADLFNLRARGGFVRSESRRLLTLTSPPPRHSDDQITHKRRKWRRRQGCEKSLVEKFRDAARRAKISELRLLGRRSWWPDGSRKSLVSPTTTNIILCPSSDDIHSVSCNSRKEPIHSKTITKNVQRDIRRKKEKKNHHWKFLLPEEQRIMIDKQSTFFDDKCDTRRKKKNHWKFWLPKEKRMMILNDDNTTVCTDSYPNLAEDDGIDNSHIRDSPLTTVGEIKNEDVDGKIGKKKKNRIAEIVTAASVSSLGIAAAIILL